MAKKSRSTIGEDPLDALVPYDVSAEDAEDSGGDAMQGAEEQPTSQSPEPDEAKTSVTATATLRTKPKRARGGAARRAGMQPTPGGTGEQPVTTETVRDLERMNKEMQVRIRELEFELTGGAGDDEDDVAQDATVSEESGSIIAMVKDLHGEIDAAYELKEALEADLAVAKDKLAAEQAGRAELEARVKLLEAKAALGEQLREDISFVEEERNETARRLEETASRLDKITEQRDGLAEQTADDERRINEIQSAKLTLEAKVLNLEESVAEMNRLRGELAEAGENAQLLEENVRNVKGKLEATETSKNALELDLATTREIVRSQTEQIEEMKEELAARHTELVDMRAKLDRQEIDRVNLQETSRRAEREIKTLSARVDSIKKELDLSKKALRDIRTAAVRTTGRVKERYSAS